MATNNIRSRRGSNTGRQSSIIDSNENKQIKQQIPAKVLVFNGKCSEIFKSTLEECVEDCILEFPGQNPIYIPKAGQAPQRSIGSRQNSNLYQSARSNRRRSSVTQLPGIRSSQTNNLTLPTVTLTATSATRMRQQFAQPKFTLVEDITEESTDYQTIVPDPTIAEIESEQQQQQHIAQEEPISNPPNSDAMSQSYFPSHHKYPSAPVYSSYRNHQKEFRLSDLVMRGPEYYAHIFNLPHKSRYSTQSTSRQSSQKTKEKYNELDLIKQDLFHRYLWTQKPQVSCRIRPISTYARNTTFVL